MKPFVFKTLLLLTLGAASADVCAAEPEGKVSWWALKPLLRPNLPEPFFPPHAARSSNPIDVFIQAKLEANGLAPCAEAERRTLLRRVYFNLIGLSPTPEEMDAFLRNQSPDAYQQVVTRLLDSPRYGERWARHWMDTAHFAETHGHDQDRIRTNAWPYRDYLITSFNADKPFTRFVEEQVAGDVLFPDDPQATTALGFLAAGPWDESSLRDIREDTLDRQIGRYLDRDDMLTTVMQTFTATTVQCARCHNHKFDPIPQRDYYSLQAVFAGVDRANRRYDIDPEVHRRRSELRATMIAVEKGDHTLLLAPTTQRMVADWEKSRGPQPVNWRVVEPEVFVSATGAMLTRQTDGALLASGKHGPTDTYTLAARPSLPVITAVRLEVSPDDSLPHRGPGREPNGNLHLSEFQALVFERGSNRPRSLKFRNPSSDYDQPGWTIAHALDGDEKTAWGIFPNVGQQHVAVFELEEKLVVNEGAQLTFVLKQLHGGHCIGRLRLSIAAVEPAARARVLPADVQQVLEVPAAQRNDNQRATLAAWIMKEKLTRELSALPPPSLIYAAASDFDPDGGLKPAGAPRRVFMLKRGEITRPDEEVFPGALTCVDTNTVPFDLANASDEGARRAALASWLTHPRNPLTWRSIVNRIWHHHFGRGLVDSPNDFGQMGGTPSHPELLDWLAVWFRDDARGSLKQLHRLIVTSAVYRQATRVEPLRRPNVGREGGTADKLRFGDSTQKRINTSVSTALDADNRLLSRMNRTRLDAEQVRDAVLQISGRLDLRMGGPGDRQFDLQPGIHVTPRVDYAKFDLDGAAGQRRGVYRFLFRTLPDPFMDALDCPAGDQLTPVRNASVTVQQALALWNNAFIARQAEHFAARLEREANGIEAQVTRAFELALNRPPTGEESNDFSAYTRQHGLANCCRLLLNSNEFMFVN